MKIRIRINEEGALRNQRFAFSDRFTLVSELLQNARRAGASLIQVHHDAQAQTLRVQDNGGGIEDFQKLLTFHESGWDDAMHDEEHPFGIGFTKCLYAAKRCVVTSRGQHIDFDTADALARRDIDVQAGDPAAAGTCVELHGVDLTDLPYRIEAMCCGFEVPVEFNGTLLARTQARGALHDVHATPIGDVFLAGAFDGKHSSDFVVYLQGFCVMRRPSYSLSATVNIVHLDSKLFMARLPDRDTLIDADRQEDRIRSALRALWRTVLLERKAELPPDEFVRSFYGAMRGWSHLDLLNDLDLLPTGSCEAIVGYPDQVDSSGREHLQELDPPPARQDIESGLVKLVSLEAPDDDNAGRWMYARAKGFVVLSPCMLDAGHWVQEHVRYLGDEEFTVAPVDSQPATTLEGRWVWPEVVLCRSVRITIGRDSVDVTDAGVHDQGTLFIPEGETSGRAVRQASNFIDSNEQFRDDDLAADTDALADLIRLLRSVDPKGTLDSLLGEVKLEKYPLLRGRTFQLKVGQAAGDHGVELVD